MDKEQVYALYKKDEEKTKLYKNKILALTDSYKKELENINLNLVNEIPERTLYTDDEEIELIKLQVFIYKLLKNIDKTVSYMLIDFEFMFAIRSALNCELQGKQSKAIVKLISEGYSKKKILKKLSIKDVSYRRTLQTIGNKLREIPAFKRYVDFHAAEWLKDDGTIKNVELVLKDIFNIEK